MNKVEKPKIIVIVGPTASGKTSLAIDIAKKFMGEVVSADSRQVYKKLDIGTEKVTQKEMAGIKHHLLDVVDLETVYSVADFKKDALSAIATILQRNKLPIIAGGTFFYIDTLLGKITTPPVAPNSKLREHLSDMSVEMLYSELEKMDSERAFTVDKHNKRRLIRALEIINELGKVPSPKEVKPIYNYNVLKIGIKTDRVELRTRISNRAQEALTKGLIEETKQLLDNGITKERLSEIGLEYRIILEYLNDELNDKQLIQKLEEKNWQYAKRQLMWLKRDESIVWVEPENREEIFQQVQDFLS